MQKVVCLLLLLFSSNLYESVNICKAKYKLYVYPIASRLISKAEEARINGTYHVCKKCIYEQFALEYVIFDYFSQFCGRTYHPEEADFFYLPMIRDVGYRIALLTGQRSPSEIESVLIDALERNNFEKWEAIFNVSADWWRKNNGMDHIIVMPAPVTNLRHQTNMRGFFHYMIHLNTPIFINVEYSRPFVNEYPVCAKEKNIVVPYPTTDPDLYSGKLFAPGFPNITRDKFIFYQGGHHGSCEFIRSALTEIVRDKRYAIMRGDKKREQGFQSAIYCPIPIGDSPSSKRMYDVMHFGCIPVVLSDDLVWAFTEETGGPLRIADFSIHLPQAIVQKTAKHLMSSQRVQSEEDINFGHRLPSGVSLFELFMEVVGEEEKEEQQEKQQFAAVMAGHNVPVQPQQQQSSRRLEADVLSDLNVFEALHLLTHDPSNYLDAAAAAADGGGGGNERRKLKEKKPAATASAEENTLIRLLKRIPPADIAALQRNVQQHARHFQYYAFNSSLPDKPLTAYHAFPTGGAIEMLDHMLAQRKERGVVDIGRRCQVERQQPGHKYVNRYPCEKR